MTDHGLRDAADEICNELASALMEKGVVTPTVAVQLQSGGAGFLSLQGGHFPHPGHKFFYSPVTMFDAARAYIAAMPDPATVALTDHMARIADCIDKGRADGIDDAYIAPLAVVKAAMSENLIAAPVAA